MKLNRSPNYPNEVQKCVGVETRVRQLGRVSPRKSIPHQEAWTLRMLRQRGTPEYERHVKAFVYTNLGILSLIFSQDPI